MRGLGVMMRRYRSRMPPAHCRSGPLRGIDDAGLFVLFQQRLQLIGVQDVLPVHRVANDKRGNAIGDHRTTSRSVINTIQRGKNTGAGSGGEFDRKLTAMVSASPLQSTTQRNHDHDIDPGHLLLA